MASYITMLYSVDDCWQVMEAWEVLQYLPPAPKENEADWRSKYAVKERQDLEKFLTELGEAVVVLRPIGLISNQFAIEPYLISMEEYRVIHPKRLS